MSKKAAFKRNISHTISICKFLLNPYKLLQNLYYLLENICKLINNKDRIILGKIALKTKTIFLFYTKKLNNGKLKIDSGKIQLRMEKTRLLLRCFLKLS